MEDEREEIASFAALLGQISVEYDQVAGQFAECVTQQRRWAEMMANYSSYCYSGTTYIVTDQSIRTGQVCGAAQGALTRLRAAINALRRSGIAALVLGGALAGCVAPPSADPGGVNAVTAPADLSVRADGLERQLRHSTLRVRNRLCLGVGSGSGFALIDRLLVTNRHVVDGAQRLQISTWDGHSLDVTVTGVAATADLAIVKTVQTLPRSLQMGETPPPGTPVLAIGYPGGNAITFSDGQVLDMVPGDLFDHAGTQVLSISNQVAPGNSGGPLVDADGNVVGVIYARERLSGRGLAVPVSTLLDTINRRGFFQPPPGC